MALAIIPLELDCFSRLGTTESEPVSNPIQQKRVLWSNSRTNKEVSMKAKSKRRVGRTL